MFTDLNYCPAETKSVVNQGTSEINQNSFPNAIANCYQTTGVTFRHHHPNAQGAMMYFYTETVKE